MSNTASPQAPAPADPKKQGPQPEYPQNRIETPGSVAEMSPRPDHGEDSYQGLGRLKDRVALDNRRRQRDRARRRDRVRA